MNDTSSATDDPHLLLTTEEDVKEGRVRILFGSPESTLGQHRQLIEDLASRNLIVMMAVDEGHCVSKYGDSRKTKSGKKMKAFRPAYKRLTELRAILGHVPLAALTATLTVDGQAKLIQNLNMKPCFKIIMPPEKNNIKYVVHRLDKDSVLEDNFQWLLERLDQKGEAMEKILVFFRKISIQGEAYEYLDDELGDQGHCGEPPYNDASHIFEMYHMRTDNTVKETILNEFSKNGHMRCVLASSSFSMGLDIPQIETVIHYGPAMDVDDFLQETGRASRDPRSKATSIVLLYPRCLNSVNITPAMKEILRTKTCRRKAILQNYMDEPQSVSPKHDCCDNCEAHCDCGDCPESPLNELGIKKVEDIYWTSSDSDSSDDSDNDVEVFRRKPDVIEPLDDE